jgi:hypothetical protein
MRVLIAFLIGAVAAGTVVYYSVNRDQTVQLAIPQPVRQEAPPPAIEAAPAPEPPPVSKAEQTPAVAPTQPVRVKPFQLRAESASPPYGATEFPEPPLLPAAFEPIASRGLALSDEKKPSPPEPHKVVLEPGTLLTVRLAEELSTEKHVTGDAFAVTLDQPLVVNGFVIAEKGSRAEGKIVSAEQAGRVKGLSGLLIQLTRFNTSDGQKINITTDSFEKKAASGKASDLAKLGAAASIGAAIGAAIGGGEGAAVGAAVGGAAGAGSVLGTRGKSVTLPSETRITFRLNSPVTITERL